MKKSEFLRILKDSLMGMNQNDKREIMLDYEEHFIDGLSEGRTEEEICESLGDPGQIALNLRRNMEYNNPAPKNDGVNTAAYIIGIIALTFGCLWLVGALIGLVLGGVSTIYATVAVSTFFSSSSLLMVIIGSSVFALCIIALLCLGIVKLTPHVMRWYKTMINGLTPDENKHIKKEFKSVGIHPAVWILLVVLLFVSLGFTITGGMITARDNAGDMDIYEIMDNIDEFEDYFVDWAYEHQDRYDDIEEWAEYHEEWAEDVEEWAEEMEDVFDGHGRFRVIVFD